MNKILIVEDEMAIADLIKIGLKANGYQYDHASDGNQGADCIEQNSYDLILLDIMLSGIDGYELLEYAKSVSTPVIFITAKGQTKDKVKGLTMGADDYIVKPFEIDELLARIAVVLRRYHKGQAEIRIGEVTIDTKGRKVTKEEKTIELTKKEFELLVLLAQNQDRVIPREQIYEQIWEEKWEEETRTLDLHIQRLRKKMNWKDKIKTVYKVGYRLEG